MSSRFDYFDGLRGLYVLIVVVRHMLDLVVSTCKDYRILDVMAVEIGVVGFFMLSSCLLTYRLTKEIDQGLEKIHSASDSDAVLENRPFWNLRLHLKAFWTSLDIKFYLLVTLKYAFRRFFRIYVTVIIYIIIRQHQRKDFNLIKALRLRTVVQSVLWTIEPECKYYFLIPAICIVMHRCKRFSLFICLLVGYLMLANGRYQVVYYVWSYDDSNRMLLHSSIQHFLSGSLVALIYYYSIENGKHHLVDRVLKNSVFKCLLTILLMVLSTVLFYGYSSYWNDYEFIAKNSTVSYLKYDIRKNHQSTVFMAVAMLIMMVSAPNWYTQIFSKSGFLKKCGKYSFGMYILHVDIIDEIRASSLKLKSGFEYLVVILSLVYFVGFLFFRVMEVPMMNVAEHLGKWFEGLKFFSQVKAKLENQQPSAQTINEESVSLLQEDSAV